MQAVCSMSPSSRLWLGLITELSALVLEDSKCDSTEPAAESSTAVIYGPAWEQGVLPPGLARSLPYSGITSYAAAPLTRCVLGCA